MNKYISLAAAAMVLLSAACKKPSSSTSCTSTLYGYTTPVSAMYAPDTTCNFGIVNESTGMLSALGTFSGCVYSNQAAYNTADNCYYTFKTSNGDATSASVLYKINASGTTTALTNSSSSAYSSLTYNRATNNLYGISGGYLVQITATATTFSSTNLATPIHPFALYGWATADPIAIDNATGNIYYVTGDSITYYIEQYHPGASAPTVVASGTGAFEIYGMQFNKNDNMLYAVKENDAPGYGYDFIKINPSTGIISSLTSLSMGVNTDYYSTCIDPCSNHYVLSTATNVTGPFLLVQLSMTGSIVQEDTTATFYQGLAIH